MKRILLAAVTSMLLVSYTHANEIYITSSAGGGTVTSGSDGTISITSSAGGGTVTSTFGK